MIEEWSGKTRSQSVVDTAEYLLKDGSDGNVVDPRSHDRRLFDAMFCMMKGMMFELERVGDQLEIMNNRNAGGSV